MPFNYANNHRLFQSFTVAGLVSAMGCQGIQPAPSSSNSNAMPVGVSLTPPPTRPETAFPDLGRSRQALSPLLPPTVIDDGVEYVYSEGAAPKQPYVLTPEEVDKAFSNPPKRTPPPGFELCTSAGKYQLKSSSSRKEAERDPDVYWALDDDGNKVTSVWCKKPTSTWFRAEAYLSPDRPPENPDDRHDVTKIRVVVPENKSWKISVDEFGDTSLLGTGPTLSAEWNGWVVGRFEPLPDGEYTLRLHTYDGNIEDKGTQTVKVIIDTKPPEIAESHVYAVEPKDDSDDLRYTIRFDMKEAEASDGSYSGAKPDSAKLVDVNVSFTPEGKLREVPPETPKLYSLNQGPTPGAGEEENLGKRYELQATLPLVDAADEKYDAFEYHVEVEDKAGNRSHDRSGFSTVARFVGAPMASAELSGAPPLLLVTDDTLTNKKPGGVTFIPEPKETPKVPWMAVKKLAKAVGVIGTAFTVSEIEVATADYASRVLLDVEDDFRENRLVPADDSWDHSQRSIQPLRGRTPFLCPQGDPLNYPIVLWLATREHVPTKKVPPIHRFRLPVTVTFAGERYRGAKAPLPAQNKEIWFRNFYEISNSSLMPKILWNGSRSDVLVKGNNTRDIAPSGNYKVSVTFGRARTTFDSPNQKNILRAPGVTFPTKIEEQTLIGFRVINNEDTTLFGPSGSAQAVPPGDEDAKQQDDPKDPGFQAWTSFIGPAGVGKPPGDGLSTHDWHHIVEQYQSHFGYQTLNRPPNLIRIPHDLHMEISLQYGQRHPIIYKEFGDPETDPPEYNALPLREWLKTKEIDFPTQHKIGLRLMKQYCVNSKYREGYEFKHQTSHR